MAVLSNRYKITNTQSQAGFIPVSQIKSTTVQTRNTDNYRPISYSSEMKQAAKSAGLAGQYYLWQDNPDATGSAAWMEKQLKNKGIDLSSKSNTGNAVADFFIEAGKGVIEIPIGLKRTLSAGTLGAVGVSKQSAGQAVKTLSEGADKAIKSTVDSAIDNPGRFTGAVVGGIVLTKGIGKLSAVPKTVKGATPKVTVSKSSGVKSRSDVTGTISVKADTNTISISGKKRTATLTVERNTTKSGTQKIKTAGITNNNTKKSASVQILKSKTAVNGSKNSVISDRGIRIQKTNKSGKTIQKASMKRKETTLKVYKPVGTIDKSGVILVKNAKRGRKLTAANLKRIRKQRADSIKEASRKQKATLEEAKKSAIDAGTIDKTGVYLIRSARQGKRLTKKNQKAIRKDRKASVKKEKIDLKQAKKSATHLGTIDRSGFILIKNAKQGKRLTERNLKYIQKQRAKTERQNARKQKTALRQAKKSATHLGTIDRTGFYKVKNEKHRQKLTEENLRHVREQKEAEAKAKQKSTAEQIKDVKPIGTIDRTGFVKVKNAKHGKKLTDRNLKHLERERVRKEKEKRKVMRNMKPVGTVKAAGPKPSRTTTDTKHTNTGMAYQVRSKVADKQSGPKQKVKETKRKTVKTQKVKTTTTVKQATTPKQTTAPQLAGPKQTPAKSTNLKGAGATNKLQPSTSKQTSSTKPSITTIDVQAYKKTTSETRSNELARRNSSGNKEKSKAGAALAVTQAHRRTTAQAKKQAQRQKQSEIQKRAQAVKRKQKKLVRLRDEEKKKKMQKAKDKKSKGYLRSETRNTLSWIQDNSKLMKEKKLKN